MSAKNRPKGASRAATPRRSAPRPPRSASTPSPGPRPTTSRRGTLLAGLAIAAVVAVVVVGVLSQRSQTTPLADGYGSARSAAVSVSAGVVRVGAPDAPVTLDAYEDFLCPNCRQFETAYGQQLAQKLDEGTVAVRYRFLTFLDARSPSKNYSTRAAAAALCVAKDSGGARFPALHAALYAETTQPKEGSGSDLSNADLAQVAGGVGASAAAQQCISSGSENAAAAAVAQSNQATLQASGNPVATPTVLNGSTKIDVSDRSWLSTLR